MLRRVLVVDDDLDIRELLCEYFRGRGWAATGVGTVAEGLAALEPSLDGLIVDQRLPDRDGSVLVREATGRGLAVLAITAFPTIDEAVELLRAGAFTLIQKPFRLKEVLENLESGIRERQGEREQRRRLAALAVLEDAALATRPEQISALENRLQDLGGEIPPAWRLAVAQARARVGC